MSCPLQVRRGRRQGGGRGYAHRQRAAGTHRAWRPADGCAPGRRQPAHLPPVRGACHQRRRGHHRSDVRRRGPHMWGLPMC